MICYMIVTLNSKDISKNRGKGFACFPACDADCRQIAVSMTGFSCSSSREELWESENRSLYSLPLCFMI